MGLYQYRPLNAKRQEIRLLRFTKDSHTAQQPLVKCTLDHVSVLDVGGYNAISYCCGSNPPLKDIILDGTVVQVSSSAEEALRGTYSQSLDEHVTSMETPVWIDAICISQSDLEEKGQQVAMMKEIYTKATQVRIWLGKDDSWTYSAFESFARLFEDYRDRTGELTMSRDVFMAERDQNLPARCNERAIYEFFSAPWVSFWSSLPLYDSLDPMTLA